MSGQSSNLPLHAVRSFLLTPEGPLWRYCLLVFPVAMIPSAVISAAIDWALGAAGADTSAMRAPKLTGTVAEAFGAIVLAPIVETLLLGVSLHILSSFIRRNALIAVASGIGWGGLHAIVGALWFFGTAWSFVIFSCAYLAWRERSYSQAFIAAAVPHALVNATVLLMVVADHA